MHRRCTSLVTHILYTPQSVSTSLRASRRVISTAAIARHTGPLPRVHTYAPRVIRSNIHLHASRLCASVSVLNPSRGMALAYVHPELRWDASPADIATQAQALTSGADARLDAIAAAGATLQSGEDAWARVVAPLAALDRDLEAANASLTFLKNVHTHKDTRDASAAAAAAIAAWEVRAGMRMDVYESVNAAMALLAPGTAGGALLDDESARFLLHTHRDMRRRGLHLPSDVRAKIERVRTEMSDICVKYQQALAEVSETLLFTRDELRGMPDSFVQGLAVKEGSDPPQFEVTLSYPHVVPLLKLCENARTRARVETAFNSRAHPENTERLARVVALRQEAAALLGYPTHAEFVLEEKMARSQARVCTFLEDLLRDLRPLAEKDLAGLLALKVAEEGADAGPITMYDYRYYMEKELRSKFSVDHDRIKEYFPLGLVLQRMLATYERILSVKFSLCTGDDVRAHVWHEDVSLYAVRDNTAGGDGALLGYFYLDLFPRTGKYSHAAVFPFVSGSESGDILPRGKPHAARVVPVCAMVCNFTKPTDSAPSLLRHEEVVTFFHEFGHVCHHLLSKTRLARFASFRCEQDFVEAPSQMLENWCWTPATLQQLSGHFKDETQQLPLELAEKLAASRIAHAGLLNVRQVFLATFDMRLHTLPAQLEPDVSAIDPTALVTQLHKDILRIPATPGTSFGASFGHLMGGYDSQYYGYLWSEVFAADMFEALFARDPLNASAGLRYRSTILARGGSRDAAEFLAEFLGREPSTAAFLRQKGLA